MPDGDTVITLDTLDEELFEAPKPGERPKPKPTTLAEPGLAGTRDDVAADLKGQLTTLQRREADARRRAQQETQRREAAETTAREAQERAQEAETRATGTRAAAFDSEIAAANSEAESLQAAITAAYQAGENEKIGPLQRKLARAEARMLLAEREKAGLANEAETVTRAHEGRVDQPERHETQRRPATDEERFEQAISGASPRTQDWLRDHPEYVTDPEKAAEASMVHHRAVRAGLRPDTDKYFEFAEQELGLIDRPQERDVTEQNGGTHREREPASRQRARTPAAPVRGGAGGGDGGGRGSTEVRLTAGEVAAATDGTIVWNTGPNKDKPIGTKEMARRKALLTQQGAYRYADAQ